MNAQERRKILDTPIPLPERITEAVIRETERQSERFRGSVRISTRRIYTDDEFEARRKMIMETPLPHME